MVHLLLAFILIVPLPFPETVEQAITLAASGSSSAAAAALDQAESADAGLYAANNLGYLRGRVAERQNDWQRASLEFSNIGAGNPLRPLAAWHEALAALHLNQNHRIAALLAELPADFPLDLRMRLAREAPPDIAVQVYAGLTSREARFQKARITMDSGTLWILLRDNGADDVALQAARLLVPTAATSRQKFDIAGTFLATRQFAEAATLYEQLQSDRTAAAEATYQLARINFLKEDYGTALRMYESVATTFPGTDWEKDARYQQASCYWRLGRFREAETAYLRYLEDYRDAQEGAARNLVDVYRALGEHAKALLLIDRTLARRPSTGTRQVLLFTKAKVFFAQERYTAALAIFRQLSQTSIRPVAGNTSTDELNYFQALALTRLKRTAEAQPILRKLAANPFTYYGQLAAIEVGAAPSLPKSGMCQDSQDAALDAATQRLLRSRHLLRNDLAVGDDALSELVFLQLWDEASLWMDRVRRPDSQRAADLHYLAGRYSRAILFADRLPRTGDALSFQYPAAFEKAICNAAASYHVDPLWLRAIIWQESKYNPDARSNAAAHGLMQFIPDTAAAVAARANMAPLDANALYDPQVSILLGARYWSELMEEFGQPELALAAYNGGPDNVRRWRDKWPGGTPQSFVSDIGFVETKRYVQAVIGARAAYGRLQERQ